MCIKRSQYVGVHDGSLPFRTPLKGLSCTRNRMTAVVKPLRYPSPVGLRKSSPVGLMRANRSTKVKNLVQYRNGKLETVLLPMLLATSILKPSKSTLPGEEVHEDQDETLKNLDEDKAKAKISAQNEAQQKDEAFLDVLLHAMKCTDCQDPSCGKMRLVLGHFLSCRKFRFSGRCLDDEIGNCSICNQFIVFLKRHSKICVLQGNAGCEVPMCDILRDQGAFDFKENVGI